MRFSHRSSTVRVARKRATALNTASRAERRNPLGSTQLENVQTRSSSDRVGRSAVPVPERVSACSIDVILMSRISMFPCRLSMRDACGVATAMSSKEVLYELLRRAILEIRVMTASEEPVDEERRKAIRARAYLVHNWPTGLRHALVDEDFDRFLVESWRRCPAPAREWMSANLRELEADLGRLGELPS